MNRRMLVAAAAAGVLGLEAGCSRLPAGAAETTVHGLLTRSPYTIAHRGGSLDWPEMSEYGYEQSVAHHAGALEISVARTADGVWFGLHDETLDRTSGTTGAVAAHMTWSAVSRYRISADETRFWTQPARPYYRLDDFLRRFAPRRVVFLDPKAADPRFYAELLAMVHRLVPAATTRVVAKSDATDTVWASMASRAGFRTWGFYYGSDLVAQPGLLAATERSWDLLGLDWEASPAMWRQVTALGKKVIGHVIDTVAERDEVLARGATGLMVADVLRVGP